MAMKSVAKLLDKSTRAKIWMIHLPERLKDAAEFFKLSEGRTGEDFKRLMTSAEDFNPKKHIPDLSTGRQWNFGDLLKEQAG